MTGEGATQGVELGEILNPDLPSYLNHLLAQLRPDLGTVLVWENVVALQALVVLFFQVLEQSE